MSKKKTNSKAAAHKALVSLDKPTHPNSAEELVLANKQQLDRIKQAADYPNQPAVQASVTALATSTDSLEKTLSAIEAKRAELDTLLAAREIGLVGVRRDRDTLRTSLNGVAKGSADTIRAWNCVVLTKAVPQPSEVAPMHLLLKNSRTAPGTVEAKCKGIREAAAYSFMFTGDPNAPLGTGQLVSSPKSRCEIAGQPLGHVVYARVAVTRKGGGQSAWSDPVQLMVR